MESKICTYSEPKCRLQLLKVDYGFEIRFNRKVIERFDDMHAYFARLTFSRFVLSICVDRTSPLMMSNITS